MIFSKWKGLTNKLIKNPLKIMTFIEHTLNTKYITIY